MISRAQKLFHGRKKIEPFPQLFSMLNRTYVHKPAYNLLPIYILGTSNWSADYFVNTGGIGFVFEKLNDATSESKLHSQLLNVFQRDWTSEYSLPLEVYTKKP